MSWITYPVKAFKEHLVGDDLFFKKDDEWEFDLKYAEIDFHSSSGWHEGRSRLIFKPSLWVLNFQPENYSSYYLKVIEKGFRCHLFLLKGGILSLWLTTENIFFNKQYYFNPNGLEIKVPIGELKI